MKLWEFNRTDVVITLKNGVVVRGFVEDYCDAFDNAEEMDSLLVDVDGTPREYFEDEIRSISVTERGLRMSKQLWDYLRSRVQVVTSDGKVIKGFVTDFIDEMDNDEQDEVTILIDNPSPDEPTEISLFETEISTIQEVK